MIERIHSLWPEIALFITTCVVMVVGSSRDRATRDLCNAVCGFGLLIAGVLAVNTTAPVAGSPLPHLPLYGKTLVAGVGLILLLVLSGVADREYESQLVRTGRPFDVIRSNKAEFYAFFMFSLTGLMLCAGADDLIWLFLALELTSLPTYVMVAISTSRNRSLEAGVKYFFLGALGAAVFLYGFALLYGGTGHTDLAGIHVAIGEQLARDGSINPIALTGAIVAVLGLCFKIAAVPMHFYTPDVYQGAASPVSAMLAFVPKSAGFFGILLVVGAVGWRFGPGGDDLPQTLRAVLWAIAALTMTAGNVLAIMQSSVKRILAYSSIAHSGYMLVGVVAGPGPTLARSGVAAVLFYLLVYGVTNVGAFAVLAALERRRPDGSTEEVDDIHDIAGLCHTRPALGWVMVLSIAGLMGLPPLVGFWGKVPLFTSAISSGEAPLVVILGLNSAIAAYYYLRIIFAAYLAPPEPAANLAPVEAAPFPARRLAGVISATCVVALAVFADPFAGAADRAGRMSAAPDRPPDHAQRPDGPGDAAAEPH